VIVGSLLLILGSIALLALGLVNGSNAYLVGSIAASLLAAIALIVGSRKASGARELAEEEPATERAGTGRVDGLLAAAAERGDYRHGQYEPTTQLISPVADEVDERAVHDAVPGRRPLVAAVQEPAIPAQGGMPDISGDLGRGHAGQLLLDEDPDDFDEEEPADEPVVQQVSAVDAARVARMGNDVVVIDGRPRYHLAGCVHLLGRASEPLPVHEAVELGFTPCGLCEPDSALLAEARRV
jgi:hypothetical protein